VHYWRALAYIERNPLRAKLCRKPWRLRHTAAAGIRRAFST
jgi:hypothetical protein